MVDKPDTCVIHVGTNRLKKDEPIVIYEDIMNIVKLCHSYGVSNVYVSSIVYRPRYIKQVSDINKLLHESNMHYEYGLVNNENINAAHMWKDDIHLNNRGIIILANNFIESLNYTHIA